MTLGQDFESIVAAARAGADWAWARLYDDLSPLVLGYSRGRGAPDPEDLTGEVFLRVVRDIERFSGNERDFRAWIMTITHHRLIDDARYRARRPATPATHEKIARAGAIGNAEEEALDGLLAQQVGRIISTLTPDQQDVLLLRILGGLTVEEVAQVLGKRPGAVKQLQRRGLAMVRKKLERQGVTL